MVAINERDGRFEVCGVAYRETFANKFKAIMAAHAVALANSVEVGKPVHVMVPMGWGDAMVVQPH